MPGPECNLFHITLSGGRLNRSFTMATSSLAAGKTAHDINYDELSKHDLFTLWLDTAQKASEADSSTNHEEYVALCRSLKAITEAYSKYDSAVKQPEKKGLNQEGEEAPTPHRMPKKKQERLAYLKTTIKEGDCFDEKTEHLLREVNGELVEHKFCSRCGEWHPLTDFYNCSANPDGLHSYCKKCYGIYEKERQRKSHWRKGKVEPVSNVRGETIETTLVPSGLQSKLDERDALDASIREDVERYELEIKRLQEEIAVLKRQSKDLDKLSEAEIRRVLDKNDYPLRLLFDAMRARTDQYVIKVTDTVSGLTHDIKTERLLPPPYSRSA